MKFLVYFLILFSLHNNVEANILNIEINQGKYEPIPILIMDLKKKSPNKDNDLLYFSICISSTIRKDLESSGFFSSVLDEMQEISKSLLDNNDLKSFKSTFMSKNIKFFFYGEITYNDNSKIEINFSLFDLISFSKLSNLSISGSKENWKKLAHTISNHIYKCIIRENSYFNSLITFIDETISCHTGKKSKRLCIMDWDGYNPRYLTNGKNLVLTPRFSSRKLEIAYMSYENEIPGIFLYNLITKENKLLGNFHGMTFAPNFSNDGNSIIMSLEEKGSSSIYKMNINTKKMKSLTSYGFIDTSPCYSPDDSSIVFSSDRGFDNNKIGLYIMDANGKNLRKISSGDGKYFQPAWSPDGNWIAFTKQCDSVFYIGILRPDGSEEKTIISGYLVESPCWSPNGREIMFTMEVGPGDKPHLYRINLLENSLKKINTPHGASDGSWIDLSNKIIK